MAGWKVAVLFAVAILLSTVAGLHGQTTPFAARSLASPELRNPVNLRRRVDGWNLDALTEVALLWHADMELARAQVATAEAGLLTAGTRPNPSLALVPQFTTPLREYQRGTYSVSLDLPIETAGKRGRRLEQAGQLAEASRSALQATAWLVRARVRANLVAFYAAQQRFDLLKTSVKHQMETAEMLQRRVMAGESSRPELLQTRLLYNQTELTLADAVKLKAESTAGVADAVGLPVAALQGIELQLQQFARLPGREAVAALAENALARRGDLLAARAEREAALGAVRSEIARRYPDLHILPGYSYDDTQNKVELGFSFELPIFHQNQGLIAEARGRVAEAEARWHAVEAKASGELALARASFTAAAAKLQTADRLLAEQQKGLESAQRLFEAGETDRLSLSTAEVERDASATLRLDALVDAQKALGALEVAAQASVDGWRPPLPAAPARKSPRP